MKSHGLVLVLEKTWLPLSGRTVFLPSCEKVNNLVVLLLVFPRCRASFCTAKSPVSTSLGFEYVTKFFISFTDFFFP